MQEVCGQALDLLGEGGGEEQGLAVARAGHVLLVDDAAGREGGAAKVLNTGTGVVLQDEAVVLTAKRSACGRGDGG